MVTVQKIVFRIRTADIEDAGTDGEVYVGFCGREFHVGTSYEDFERGAERTYSAGMSAVAGEVNVNNPTLNDPRSFPPLDSEDIGLYPVYVRFEPVGRYDHWCRQYISVSAAGVKYEALEPEDDTTIYTFWDTNLASAFIYIFHKAADGQGKLILFRYHKKGVESDA